MQYLNMENTNKGIKAQIKRDGANNIKKYLQG